MFCSVCGTQLQPDYIACPKCGKRIGDPLRVVGPSRLERHLRTLGILWIVIGGLFLIPATVLMTLSSTLHFIVHGREPFAHVLGPLLFSILGGSFLVLGAGGVCVGWGLMQRRPWARITALVLGVLSLFHPPFGTALGVYTLWVLLADDHGAEYERMARAA